MYRKLKFVTNSSSSHSMVINPKQKLAHYDDWMPGEFGWQLFVLTTKEQKEVYMAVTAFENLTRYKRFSINAEEAIREVNRQFGHKVLSEQKEDDYYYIDHQSLMALPQRAAGHATIDWEFFWELTDYIVNNEDLVIIGGNDNDAPQDQIKWGGTKDKIYDLIPVDIDTKGCFSLPIEPRIWEISWMGWSGMKEKKLSQIIKFPYSDVKRKRANFKYGRAKTHDRNK